MLDMLNCTVAVSLHLDTFKGFSVHFKQENIYPFLTSTGTSIVHAIHSLLLNGTLLFASLRPPF